MAVPTTCATNGFVIRARVLCLYEWLAGRGACIRGICRGFVMSHDDKEIFPLTNYLGCFCR